LGIISRTKISLLPVDIKSTRDTGLFKKQLKTFYSTLHTPSVPYLASKQTIVCYRLTVLHVRLFLTGIPSDTCKGPLVNL